MRFDQVHLTAFGGPFTPQKLLNEHNILKKGPFQNFLLSFLQKSKEILPARKVKEKSILTILRYIVLSK